MKRIWNKIASWMMARWHITKWIIRGVVAAVALAVVVTLEVGPGSDDPDREFGY